MADETTNDKDQNFAKLREKNERLAAEVKQLRGIASKGIAAQAGLDPSDPVVGLVQERWEGGIEDLDDFTAESFTEFAGSFNLLPSDGGDGGNEATDDDDDDFSAQLEAAQSKSDKAKGDLKAPKSKDRDSRIDQFEKDGDFNASFHEKIASLSTL